MLPEVKEYLDTKEKADRELQDWHANSRKDQPLSPNRPSWTAPDSRHSEYEKSYREYQEEYRVWNQKFHAGFTAANEKHKETMRAARATLREKTNDPVIKWIMNDMTKGYWSYIEAVLPILPATREQLENLANDQDWCSEFDEFLGQATEAGIIPPVDESYDAQEIVDWVSDEFDVYGRRHRRQIQAMVNRIVERALAEKLAPVAKAS